MNIARLASIRLTTIANAQGQGDLVDEMVYFGSDDGFLYALDRRNGQQLQKFAAEQLVCSSPLILDEMLYFGSDGARHPNRASLCL